jgi:hypothetical protein
MREGSWARGGGWRSHHPLSRREPARRNMGSKQAQHPPLREAMRELAYSVWMGLCFLGLLWIWAIRKQH